MTKKYFWYLNSSTFFTLKRKKRIRTELSMWIYTRNKMLSLLNTHGNTKNRIGNDETANENCTENLDTNICHYISLPIPLWL